MTEYSSRMHVTFMDSGVFRYQDQIKRLYPGCKISRSIAQSSEGWYDVTWSVEEPDE